MPLHHRVCNLCEAMCGVTIEHDGQRVLSIRGDADDPFSQGDLCPKAVALQDLHEDPDRLRRPQKRVGDRFVEVGWEEAFAEIGERARAIRREHGSDALGFYQGNPTIHNYGSMIYGLAFGIGLGTKNRYSATSVDQLPRMLSSLLLFGHQALLPIPDVDRTQYFLMLGANPLVSGGSLMTAGGIERRLRALQARGGKLVVVDPRRTATAELADEHLAIRPGSDALFLFALLHTLFAEKLERPGRLASLFVGEESVRAVAARFSPEEVAAATGLEADTIRRIARELAGSPRAVVYSRVGVSLSEFGALATWACDLLNLMTGNLDREGGSMFTSPAIDVVALSAAAGQAGSYDTYRSRVRGLPEFGGELPVATLADEIEAEGRGQLRALITSAGNPVLSTPNGPRVARALRKLELLVSIDLYRNETTQHAHFILPPTSPLEHEHYDLALHLVAVRNTAKFSPALFTPPPDSRHDWEIFLGLWSRILGDGAVGAAGGALLRLVGRRMTPERLIALGLRLGRYGDRFLPFKKGLSLEKLRASAHGLDLGPLVPRLPAALYTEDGAIHLGPQAFLDDVARLQTRAALWAAEAALPREHAPLVLIGRRELRSNNSWMHNSLRLVKGPARCTLLIHPDDAAGRGISSGARVTVRSRVGAVDVAAKVSDEVRPGVVSLPHGWGHGQPGAALRVASAHAGVSANALTDERYLDLVSGNASLNGVPVSVVLAPAGEAEPAQGAAQ